MEIEDVKIILVPSTDIKIGIVPIVGKGREAEQSSIYMLLYFLLQEKREISHNIDGKPLLRGYNISISHTRGWATVMLSRKYYVGVDIEYQSDRIQRIIKKFLRSDEIYTSINDLLYIWCAKESLYKLKSELHLSFKEMRVDVSSSTIYEFQTKKQFPILQYSTSEYLLTCVWEAMEENRKGNIAI